jgi:molecular chaperone DnaK
VGEAERNAITTALEDLNGSLESGDAEAISAKTNTLIQASMKLGEAMYQAQQGQGAAGEQPEAQAEPGSEDVVDAEFEEVNGDEKKSA